MLVCVCACVCVCNTQDRRNPRIGRNGVTPRVFSRVYLSLELADVAVPEHLGQFLVSLRGFVRSPDDRAPDCVLDCDSGSWYAAARPRLRRLLVLVASDRRHRTLFCTVTHITGGSWHSRLSPAPPSFPGGVYVSSVFARVSSGFTDAGAQVCAGAYQILYLRLPNVRQLLRKRNT
mgnify:CR=1 FL=1